MKVIDHSLTKVLPRVQADCWLFAVRQRRNLALCDNGCQDLEGRDGHIQRRLQMAGVSKEEIIQKMEELKDGARLSLQLSPTFGAGAVIIELNPSHNEKGQKRYLMWWGKDAVKVRATDPFMASDKAKKIASWVADRLPHWLA